MMVLESVGWLKPASMSGIRRIIEAVPSCSRQLSRGPVTISITERDERSVVLDAVVVFPGERGRGRGSESVLDLVSACRSCGLDLYVSIKPLNGFESDKERLVGWFESMGFRNVSDDTYVLESI